MSGAMTEKQNSILPSGAGYNSKLKSPVNGSPSKTRFVVNACIVLGLYAALRACVTTSLFSTPYGSHKHGSGENDSRCSQTIPVLPENHRTLWDSVNTKIGAPEFKQAAVDWLAGAVRVPTESFDNMPPVGEDSRWEAFGPFHDYLLSAFPLVHTSLKLTKVNTYGLHYEWEGSDETLKPILLAAHQDVVPVDPTTVNQWTHPPYSGYFDGTLIWGRGSSDDKGGLIGILSSIETLLEAGFKPKRTVVLAFGFDEEASGFQGAGHLGPHLEEVYGKDSFAMIVDEGSGFAEQYGSVFATPGIAEKGYLNVLVEVSSPGGHSSVPPDHTSIGILAALLVHFEKNPIKAKITRHEPVYDTLQCVAQHGKEVPSKLRSVIGKSLTSKKALEELQGVIQGDKLLRSLVGTTQAIDLIQGGVKSNALPEQAWAVVNRRIAVTSSVAEVEKHDAHLLAHLAKHFNLTYTAFGEKLTDENAPASGALTISDAFDGSLEPAPITPTGKDAAPYQLLSGTIKATFNAHRSLDGPDNIVVAPSMMSGNTDTRFYWDLSPHIFRYNHQNSGNGENPLGGIHTVNENANVDAFLEMIRFFTTLILNADESQTL